VGSSPITHPIDIVKSLLSLKMEDENILELNIKYGLNSSQTQKIIDTLYQAGIINKSAPEFMEAASYICENDLVEMPTEKLLEELKRKQIIPE
jgi:hypothetical protein